MKNGLIKIDSIMYFVKDLVSSAKFYEEVLGLKKVWTDKERGMIGFVFPQSDSEIVIHNDNDLPNPDFSFLVEDVEAVCNEIENIGYKVLQEPVEVRTGKFAVISDLDGNKLPIIYLTAFDGKPRYD